MSRRRIIYYSGYSESVGGFTVGEWLIYWTWQYLISQVNIFEYESRLDYITVEMPGATDESEWDEVANYLKLLRK